MFKYLLLLKILIFKLYSNFHIIIFIHFFQSSTSIHLNFKKKRKKKILYQNSNKLSILSKKQELSIVDEIIRRKPVDQKNEEGNPHKLFTKKLEMYEVNLIYRQKIYYVE